MAGRLLPACGAGLLAALAGCASYAVPGRGADMQALAAPPADEAGIEEIFAREPLATFPTALAVVRVQEPGYRSYSTPHSHGGGRYSVVTARDVETDSDLARLAALPEVRGVAPCSALLVPDRIDGAPDLRALAAQLHADVLLVYTIDTVFTTEDRAQALTLISLGLLPTKRVHLTSTASAILLDTRSGFLYGAVESTNKGDRRGFAWSTEEDVETTRRSTEREALAGLLREVEKTWSQVLAYHAAPAQEPAAALAPESPAPSASQP